MLQLLLLAGIMAVIIALVVYQVHKIRWLRDHGRRVRAMVTPSSMRRARPGGVLNGTTPM